MALSDLDDACQVRLFAADPPLQEVTWKRLASAMDKLFAQFQREEMVSHWGFELLGGGSVILTGWRAATPLSGCRQDRLGRLLLAYEQEGQLLLNALGMVVEVRDRSGWSPPRLYQRAQLRALALSGDLDGQSLWWDLQADTLGDWRHSGRKPLVETPLGARILHNAG